ncbi:MAG: nuclear transport factor 2 family protein [Acidimicrobiia bacterium]|nr:nuclear transport factor 2 family protein [Acidimicrobiia bacterium]
MRKYVAGTIVIVALAGAVNAQQGIVNQKQVSPLDYVQILQLYARYSHAVDLVVDDGTAYSSNFTEDGVLKFGNSEVRGRAAIKAWADKTGQPKRIREKGWHAGHPMSNFQAIQITPDLARVIFYQREGASIADDIVVRTPQGWLIKRRSPTCGTEEERKNDPNRPPCDATMAPPTAEGGA